MSAATRFFHPAFVVAAAIFVLILPHVAANEYELRLVTLLLIYAINNLKGCQRCHQFDFVHTGL